MKEKELISIIKNIAGSKYIGDDCAYLEDLKISVTHDSLVEDVHFKRSFTTAYALGYKAVMVNLSDIAASGASPKYLTIAISLPADIGSEYVSSFYEGAKKACGDDVKIIGGDITGADKIFISICAIGVTENRKISSRKNAQIGQKVIVSGNHGSSSAGLRLLFEGKKTPEKFIEAHLKPNAQIEFGKHIATAIKEDYAMMDTSDGLMDALFTIANESNVLLDIDFDKIPFDKDLKTFSDYKNLILFGGEDYQIIATVPQDFDYGTTIGQVKQGFGVDLTLDNEIRHYTKQDVEQNLFNHFKKN